MTEAIQSIFDTIRSLNEVEYADFSDEVALLKVVLNMLDKKLPDAPEIRAAGAPHASSSDAQAFAVDGLTKINDETECGSVTVTAGPDGTQEVSVLVLWRGIDKQNRQVEVTTLVGR